MIDKRLLDILCDPVTKSPVRPLSAGELDALARAVTAGTVNTEGGSPLKAPPSAGLITRDAGPLYARHGFTSPAEPSGYMEIVDRKVYQRERTS